LSDSSDSKEDSEKSSSQYSYDGGYRSRSRSPNYSDDSRLFSGFRFGYRPKVSNIAEGAEFKLLSNHFRFSPIKKGNLIFIYIVDYGVFNAREMRFEALRSIAEKLKGIFGVYFSYGRHIYSLTRIE
jgi:hypothetical protein